MNLNKEHKQETARKGLTPFLKWAGGNGFYGEDQGRIKMICDILTERGCNVLASNSNTPFIRNLYSDSRYKIEEVEARRAINSVGTKRGNIKELLIHNRYKKVKFS